MVLQAQKSGFMVMLAGNANLLPYVCPSPDGQQILAQ